MLMGLLLSTIVLGVFSLQADQAYDLATMMKIGSGIDISECPEQLDKYAQKDKKTVSSSNFIYQYTSDGWLQQLVIYSDFIVGTNLEGPREGLQIIMWENLAMDMCQSYKQHKGYITHKYTWGEIRTYEKYQKVIFN